MTDTVLIALIGGIATSLPIIVTQLVTVHSQNKKIAEVKTEAVQNAAIAVEVAGKAAVVSETIHGLVNSKLAEEKKAKEDAQALNVRLLAILESHGVKVPPLSAPK